MLRKLSYGILLSTTLATIRWYDPSVALHAGWPTPSMALVAGLLLISAASLIHSATLSVARARREAELEDAGAEAGLGNLDEEVRHKAVAHFKGTARAHMNFFLRALISDTIPLLGVSALAGFSAVSLAQKLFNN